MQMRVTTAYTHAKEYTCVRVFCEAVLERYDTLKAFNRRYDEGPPQEGPAHGSKGRP